MDLNLEVLKSEILEYLERSDFAVFRSEPGGLEGMSIITWDVDRCPDYRAFLEAAHKSGEKMILFASREMTADEVEEAAEELIDNTDFTREERRELETRLARAQKHIGATCVLELAFGHNSHLYVYEARPDWYDEFLEACDEISSMLSIDSEQAGSDGLGGFYSNN